MFEVRETGNPEVPLYFGEGLRRSLGNAAGYFILFAAMVNGILKNFFLIFHC